MVNLVETFTKYIINIDPLRVTGVGHSMIANKHDVHNVGQVPSF